MNDLATILTLVVPLVVAAIVPLLLGRVLPKRPADAAVRATQAEAAAKLAQAATSADRAAERQLTGRRVA